MRKGVWLFEGRAVTLKQLSAELETNHSTFRKHVWQYGLPEAVQVARMTRQERQQWRYEKWRDSYYDDDV